MNWGDFFDELFTPPLTERQQTSTIRRLNREVDQLRERSQEVRRDSVSARSDLRDEIEVLHANFARALLLLQALTTTLLRKQAITREELQAIIQELDLLDGQADRQLDPAATPGMQSRPAERRSTEAALDDLARRPALDESTSPREFLKQLENREEPKQ
jgi:hypothetical protein